MPPTIGGTTSLSTTNPAFHSLTVGRIDSGGLAIVLTEDLEMLEVPASLLPPGSGPGSTVRLQLMAAPEVASQHAAVLLALQQRLLTEYGQRFDEERLANCLSLVHATHTTVMVRWPAWTELCAPTDPRTGSKSNQPHLAATGGAQLHAIEGYIDDRPLPAARFHPEECTLRLTGLEPNHSYILRLVFRTSAGRFSTVPLTVRTRPLEDLSCLHVVADAVSPETLADLQAIGVQLGTLSGETNLVVSGRNRLQLETDGQDDGALLRTSQQANVPIVTPAWVRACKEAGRMQSVSQFYPT